LHPAIEKKAVVLQKKFLEKNFKKSFAGKEKRLYICSRFENERVFFKSCENKEIKSRVGEKRFDSFYFDKSHNVAKFFDILN
jgi:hypothetical protein